MGNRRASREFAIKILYQKDITKVSIGEVLDNFWPHHECSQEVRKFTDILVKGAVLEQEKIDSLIEKYSEHWMIDRIGIIEKNILRCAVYEFMGMDDIPPNVTINEAIEITKKFGSEDSPQFINGLLDRIKKSLIV